MRRWERRLFNLSALTVAATGCAFFWMKHAMSTDDPFALVNHPWQPAMLNLHVIASPLLVLAFGIILNSHIMRKLGAGRVANRRSGLTALATFATMTVSGYLLQVTSDENWLRAWIVLHVVSGTLFCLTYVVHLLISARLARSSRARAMPQQAA